MNLLFIGCLMVTMLFAIGGYRKGLVKVLFSIGSFFAIMIVVGIISPMIGDVLREKTTIHETVSQKCIEVVQDWNEEHNTGTLEGRVQAIDEYEIPDIIKDYLKEGAVSDTLQTDFTAYISGKIADLTISGAAYIIALIVVGLIFGILTGVLDLVAKLPVLNSINHLGGLLAGVAESLLVIWCFFLLVTIFCTSSWGSWCMEMISESNILSYIYEKNIILNFIPGLKVI